MLDIDEDNQMSVRVGLEDRELEIVFQTSVERMCTELNTCRAAIDLDNL